MVGLDGIGRESERVELKGESLRKVLTLPTILKITNGLNGYHRNGPHTDAEAVVHSNPAVSILFHKSCVHLGF